MFLFMLRSVWFVVKHIPGITELFVFLVVALLIVFIVPSMFAKPLPETIPTQGPEPTEAEFNSPE